jgi:hypothetical protein
MLVPMLVMAVATKFFYGAVLLSRARVLLLTQDLKKQWASRALDNPGVKP